MILSSLLCLMTLAVLADNRSLAEMRSIAAAKLNRSSAVKGQMNRVKPAALQLVAEDNAYTIFSPADAQGFVIVAKSNLVDPVIAYSTERFDATNMPPGFRCYLAQASRTMEAIEAGRMQAPRRIASFTPVENFVTTKWSQDYPFNRSTPNNYPTGCVATALAQCLNYCQYPPSVDFEGNYWVTTKQGNKEKTEKKTEHVSTTYTWPYKDTYKSIGRTGDNIDELLRDCGYASYMQYTEEFAGTGSIYASSALTRYFQYPESCIKYYDKDDFGIDQETWNQMIYDELAVRSPILYGAFSSDGGHAFLLTGVDAEGLVYINWGWRGNADGFYAMELMDPDGQGDGFTDGPHMITGIRPTPLATDKKLVRIESWTGNPYTFRWGTSTDDDGVERHTLYCDIPHGLVNKSPVTFRGVFGLFAQDLTDGSTWVIAEDLQDRDTVPSGYGAGGDSEQYKDFYFYYVIDGEQGLKPGHTYRMAFGTRDDEEGIWHSILCLGGELAYDVTYTGDPATSTVSEEKTPLPLIDAIHAVREDASSGMASANLTRVYDATGRVVYTVPTCQFNLWDVPARGILVVKQGNSVRKVVR